MKRNSIYKLINYTMSCPYPKQTRVPFDDHEFKTSGFLTVQDVVPLFSPFPGALWQTVDAVFARGVIPNNICNTYAVSVFPISFVGKDCLSILRSSSFFVLARIWGNVITCLQCLVSTCMGNSRQSVAFSRL